MKKFSTNLYLENIFKQNRISHYMFKKKPCPRCNRPIKNSYDFCPSCGNKLKENTEQYGLLGKNDFTQLENRTNVFGIAGGMLGKMLSGTMKMLEKELQKELNNQNKIPNTQMQLFINGQKITVGSNAQEKPKKQMPKEITLPQQTLKGFNKLPKKEPQTNLRRLSDKVIYEIKLPGVNSQENISITKLANSIEIRAMSKSKSYFKTMSINLPIIDYSLNKGTLTLEFGLDK